MENFKKAEENESVRRRWWWKKHLMKTLKCFLNKSIGANQSKHDGRIISADVGETVPGISLAIPHVKISAPFSSQSLSDVDLTSHSPVLGRKTPIGLVNCYSDQCLRWRTILAYLCERQHLDVGFFHVTENESGEDHNRRFPFPSNWCSQNKTKHLKSKFAFMF